jgi:hypothetical protein
MDFFRAERPTGDMVCSYKDFEVALSDGTKLLGCVFNYVTVRRLASAYVELFLKEDDPGRAAGLIAGMRDRFLANPEFLLPQAMRNNEIKTRQNAEDVHVRYNQLPILPCFTVYPTARLDLSTKELLLSRWKEKGVELVIYDQNYVDAHHRKLRPYAFICHDSRDKESVAKPLAARLKSDVGTVWYDEYSLTVGDSLREGIEKGLKQSDRCIMILSKAFLQNEGWVRREFDSIYTREIVEKQRVMLPIWVDVTARDLYEYSPILADRVGTRWDTGIDEVVSNLARALRNSKPNP